MLAALPAGASKAIELVTPIECPEGVFCYIQSLVDRDAGPGAQDFACGPLSYDGHQGVDFRVPTMADLARGVPILAAAPGVVRATRDGEREEGAKGVAKGRDCGNGVVLDHGGGWTTQYCHLAMGGVEVSNGQRVAAGERIGRMGFSGRTDFPHLHLTLRRNGVVVDPFDGRISRAGCEAPDERDLWLDPVAAPLGGLVDEAIVGAPPTLEAVREGRGAAPLTRKADVLVFWSRAYGVRIGDEVDLTLYRPDGSVLAETVRTLERNRFEEMSFVGRKRPAGGWAPGRYRAVSVLRREGAIMEQREIFADIP